MSSDSAIQNGPVEPPRQVLPHLESVIISRKEADPAGSYVARLLQEDEDHLLRKIGEEATEVILAAKSGDPEAISSESADLLFHLLVMLARYDLRFRDIEQVLESRMK